MQIDLDQLKAKIEEDLKAGGFIVFRGHTRLSESAHFVYWDTERSTDPAAFLETASQAGERLIVLGEREFTASFVDDALERLEDAELPPDERRAMERRVKALRRYEGFLCGLDLSFDHGGRTYCFSLRTEWYEELLDVLDEIDASFAEDDEDEDGEEPLGGYFSRN